MGMATLDTDRPGWRFSWGSAIAGTVVAVGLFIVLMLLGTALGLSAADPWSLARNENAYGLGIGAIIWTILAAVLSAFVGGLLSAHLAWLDRDDALLQGAVVWGLFLILTTSGLSALAPENRVANDRGPMGLQYNSLSDPQFTGFVLDRARDWRPGTPPEPVNVSAEASKRVNPKDVADDNDLQRFVTSSTRLDERQAEQFLTDNRDAIANALADSQVRWERENAAELSNADRARRMASTLAWTLFGLAFGALLATLGGSLLGSSLRDRTATSTGPIGRGPAEPAPARETGLPPGPIERPAP